MRRAARASLSTALAVVVAGTMSACGGTRSVEHTIDAARIDGFSSFDPLMISVDKRNKVEITVGNTTDTLHGFSIEGYGIREQVSPGNLLEVEFTAGNAGVYKVYCQLHEAHKTATLVVR